MEYHTVMLQYTQTEKKKNLIHASLYMLTFLDTRILIAYIS